MSGPEEFTLTIMPDGRILFQGAGVEETDYKRILEFLEEMIGPVTPGEGPPENPGRLFTQPGTQEEELEQRSGK